MNRGFTAVWVVGVALAGAGCSARTPAVSSSSSSSSPVPTGAMVKVTIGGTEGAAIHGFYIDNGTRVPLRRRLPVVLEGRGISIVAVGKLNAADDLSLSAETEDGDYVGMSSPPGDAQGIGVQIGDGTAAGHYVSQRDLTERPGNSLMVIEPYWDGGTWVFDDEELGLHKEPFVAGVPEMIDHMVRDIPDARQGCRVTFSAAQFPGWQYKLTWVKQEAGGNIYRLDRPRMQGWMCPALFKYFEHAPRQIYVKAEPKA
jgi:hypothetical protein